MAQREVLNLVVAGAHMSGLPLHHQLISLAATFIRAVKTAPVYRMYSLGNRPSLVHQTPTAVADQQGSAFEVEVWALPMDRVGEFLRDGVRPPLAIGDVELEDGSSEKGFVGESYAVTDAPDISSFGGWRAFVKHRQEQESASAVTAGQ